MDALPWKNNGDEYELKTPYGKAIITELDGRAFDRNSIDPHNRYAARFEHSNGAMETAAEPFNNFDHAEGWLLYEVLETLDLPFEVPAATQRLEATLDYCEQLLQGASDPTHVLRLRHIKRILAEGNKTIDQAAPVPNELARIDWKQMTSSYQADTEHGKAEIRELAETNKWRFGGRPTFVPRLSDPSGVIMQGPSCSDFEEAEAWIKARLFELSHPTGDELDYENLQYTLQVCIQALPASSNPIHFFRLQWMDGRLADILL